jgi:hypothetical protein
VAKKRSYFVPTDIKVVVQQIVPDGNSSALFMTVGGGEVTVESGILKGKKMQVTCSLDGSLIFEGPSPDGSKLSKHRYIISSTDFAQAVIDHIEKVGL